MQKNLQRTGELTIKEALDNNKLVNMILENIIKKVHNVMNTMNKDNKVNDTNKQP